MTQKPEPKLGRPGAGLPIPFRWIARFALPRQASKSTWEDNARRFEKYSRAIDEIVSSLTEEQLNIRALVKPITGLEDSSRYWSVGMVLDHMIIVGTGMHLIISETSHNRSPPVEAKTENVKPPVLHHDLASVQKFHQFWLDFVPTLKLGNQLRSATVKHPWFGQLNAHQWFHVLSLHQRIHHEQVQQIVASFKSDRSK